MGRYSEEFRVHVVRQMMPPDAVSVEDLSRETGVTATTLYNWRKRFRSKGVVVPGKKGKADQWSSEDKFAVVVETSPMNESELSEYCRRTGLYQEQIASWRRACLLANESADKLSKAAKRQKQEDRKKVKGLERELRRKEKALAEAAALLILKKKAEARWGDAEDDT